jgi:hypothetical protein
MSAKSRTNVLAIADLFPLAVRLAIALIDGGLTSADISDDDLHLLEDKSRSLEDNFAAMVAQARANKEGASDATT